MKKKALLLCNFEVDTNSKVLAFACDWINEISNQFENVIVLTLNYNTTTKLNKNVYVFSVNSKQKSKVNTIASIYCLLLKIHFSYMITGYFIHMAHIFAPFLYPFAKLRNKKILLWYAHKAVPLSLILSEKLVDKIFSVSSQSFKLKSKKFTPIGHGIDTENRFKLKIPDPELVRITSIGRITKVKNTDLIIKAFYEVQKSHQNLVLELAGSPVTLADNHFKKQLQDFINRNFTQDKVRFLGDINYSKVPELYNSSRLTINVGDGALDKAIIESLASGTPVITTNDSAKELFHLYDQKTIFLTTKSQLANSIQAALNTSIQESDFFDVRDLIEKNFSIKSIATNISRYFKYN